MTVRKKVREDIRQSFDKLSDEVLIDDSQIAALAGYSPSTVKRWRRQGKLPQVVLIYGRPRHRVGNVRELLKGLTPGTSD